MSNSAQTLATFPGDDGQRLMVIKINSEAVCPQVAPAFQIGSKARCWRQDAKTMHLLSQGLTPANFF
jgi:hypothetical protein